nr:MAG TPA: hypothetical protein [Caudoviricetes sp.]
MSEENKEIKGILAHVAGELGMSKEEVLLCIIRMCSDIDAAPDSKEILDDIVSTIDEKCIDSIANPEAVGICKLVEEQLGSPVMLFFHLLMSEISMRQEQNNPAEDCTIYVLIGLLVSLEGIAEKEKKMKEDYDKTIKSLLEALNAVKENE